MQRTLDATGMFSLVSSTSDKLDKLMEKHLPINSQTRRKIVLSPKSAPSGNKNLSRKAYAGKENGE